MAKLSHNDVKQKQIMGFLLVPSFISACLFIVYKQQNRQKSEFYCL